MLRLQSGPFAFRCVAIGYAYQRGRALINDGVTEAQKELSWVIVEIHGWCFVAVRIRSAR